MITIQQTDIKIQFKNIYFFGVKNKLKMLKYLNNSS